MGLENLMYETWWFDEGVVWRLPDSDRFGPFALVSYDGELLRPNMSELDVRDMIESVFSDTDVTLDERLDTCRELARQGREQQ